MSSSSRQLRINTHNGRFTIQNILTGVHRTFKVETGFKGQEWAKNKRIVSLLTQPDNVNGFAPFATLRKNNTIKCFKNKIDVGDWRAYAGMLWSFANDNFSFLKEGFNPDNYEILEETCCRRCNRPLTNPESIRSGIGPYCAEKE